MTAVFLSYTSADVGLASELLGGLRAQGYSAFRDRDAGEGIPAGTRWAGELFTSLDRADVVVFLASRESLASPWCHTELAVAVARGCHVVQVGLQALPPHPVLTDRQLLPVAADADGLRSALVRDLTRVGFPPADPFGWDPEVSPYPGLRRLGAEHAAVLFGRDVETATLLGRLAQPSAAPVLVVGPSGSGKSSFVRAGALPRLTLRPATVVLPVVEPGGTPLRRVAAAFASRAPELDPRGILEPGGLAEAVDHLAVRGGRVVLALDQAEDLLAAGARGEAAELMARLSSVQRDRLAVIVVLRSASLESWLRDADLGGFTPGDPVWVRPLDRSNLREVIVRPARLAGIRFEPPELVERILDDTGDGYALPLLAALLEELTEGHSRLSPAVVSAERYRTVGPVRRVVEGRAATATAQLRAERGVDEAVVVQAYLRLVDIDPNRQVTRAEVVVDQQPDDVVEVLAVLERHRLVTRDRRLVAGEQPLDVVTPVHEEVFRAWPALAAAIDAQRGDLELRSVLRRDARAWAGAGGGAVGLTGGRLQLALDWCERHPADVEAAVARYVAAAVHQRRRRRALLTAAPLLTVAVLVVGALAVSLARQAQRADRARSLAEGLRLAGEARAVGVSRPDLALQLSLEAAARAKDLQVQAAPLVALTRGPGPRSYRGLGAPVPAGSLDRSGTRALLLRPDGAVLWDVTAGRAVATLPAAAVAALSGDGSVLAAAGGDTTPAADGADTAGDAGAGGVAVRGWAPVSSTTTCAAPGGPVELLRLSTRGDRLLVVTVDRGLTPPRSTVNVLSLPGCRVTARRALSGLVVDADLDTARDLLVLGVAAGAQQLTGGRGGAANGVLVWQLSSGLPFDDLAVAAGSVRAVALGADDVAALTADGDLLTWGLRTPRSSPRRVAVMPVAGVGLRPLPPAATGSAPRWLAYGADGGLRVVDPGTTAAVSPARWSLPELGWPGSVVPVAVTTAQGRTVTLDPSGRVVTWDLDATVALGDVTLASRRLFAVASLADGTAVALGAAGLWLMAPDSGARQVAVSAPTALSARGTSWAVGTRTGLVLAAAAPGRGPVQVGRHAAPVAAVAVLDDGSVASADTSGRLQVVTRTGSRTGATLREEPRSMATDGRLLYVGTRRGVVLVVDPRDLQRRAVEYPAHTEDASAAAVSPDGATLATGGDDREVLVWTVGPQGRLARRLRLVGQGDRVTSLAFSPDGALLASGGEDATVLLWDLGRGEQVGEPITLPVTPGLAFTAGRQLLVAGQGLARWPMTPAAWGAAACRVLGGRSLSTAEQQRFLRGSAPRARCPSSS